MARVLSAELRSEIEALTDRYPVKMGALIPALHLVQDQHGCVAPEAQDEVAELLEIPTTRVREVVTFYTMFYEAPVGRNVVKICRNLSCQLRGADRILARAKAVLGIDVFETTEDGRITLEHEECLASCGTGPMLWCNGRYYENLDEAKLDAILGSLK